MLIECGGERFSSFAPDFANMSLDTYVFAIESVQSQPRISHYFCFVMVWAIDSEAELVVDNLDDKNYVNCVSFPPILHNTMSFASTSSSRILLPCCRAARQLPQQRSLATNSTSRASSSTLTGSDSTYHRPLKSGELPVYDRALAYIQEDREKKLASLKYLRQQLEQTSSEDRKAVLQERILGLEVTSEINDPEVRWKYKNGLGENIISL